MCRLFQWWGRILSKILDRGENCRILGFSSVFVPIGIDENAYFDIF